MTAQGAVPEIRIARVRDDAAATQGARLLVDRVWPRGLRKADLRLDDWLRDIAPSTGLRKWFGHDPERWDEFRARYQRELDANPAAVERGLNWCRKGPVTLLFGARDRELNQAVVLRDYLTRRLKDGS